MALVNGASTWCVLCAISVALWRSSGGLRPSCLLCGVSVVPGLLFTGVRLLALLHRCQRPVLCLYGVCRCLALTRRCARCVRCLRRLGARSRVCRPCALYMLSPLFLDAGSPFWARVCIACVTCVPPWRSVMVPVDDAFCVLFPWPLGARIPMRALRVYRVESLWLLGTCSVVCSRFVIFVRRLWLTWHPQAVHAPCALLVRCLWLLGASSLVFAVSVAPWP